MEHVFICLTAIKHYCCPICILFSAKQQRIYGMFKSRKAGQMKRLQWELKHAFKELKNVCISLAWMLRLKLFGTTWDLELMQRKMTKRRATLKCNIKYYGWVDNQIKGQTWFFLKSWGSCGEYLLNQGEKNGCFKIFPTNVTSFFSDSELQIGSCKI